MPEEPALVSIQSFTSSESGAWSNAYLISGRSRIILFDVPMLRSDATKLADIIEKSKMRLTIEDMIAEGDKVMCRNIWRWTDPASGRRMQFHGFVLWRFEGDKIAERWATVTPLAEDA